MCGSLGVGRPLEASFACSMPVCDCEFVETGFRVGVCHNLRLRLGDLALALFEHSTDAGAQFLKLGPEKGAVGGILDKGMLERERRVQWPPTSDDQTSLN